MIWSCSEDLDPVISSDPQSPVLMSPESGTSLVLTAEEETKEVIFEYQEADYGFSAATRYTVQMDLVGNGFAESVDVINSTSNKAILTYADLNQKLLSRGLMPNEGTTVEMRIKAFLNDNVSDEFSETITMSLTPYEVALQYPKMYVPGDYQGWNPANENTILYSVKSNNVYEGFVHLITGNGEFKVNEGPNWDVNYGDDGADGILDAGGANLKVDAKGTYKLTVNLNDKTYSIGAPLYWGIIGDATTGGWDSSTPMEYNADENILTLTTALSVGNMKFRANDAWDNNYGDDEGDGELEAGGSDIAILEAGNYTITMDFKVPGEVSYTLVKN